jgi:hypothetical protein
MTPFSPSVGTPPLTPVDLTWYIRPLLTRRYLSTMVQVALGVLNPSTCQLCLASPPRCLSTLLRVPHSPLIPPPPPSLGMRRRPGLMRPSRTTVRALPLAFCFTWRLARPLGIVASPSTRLAIGTRLKCRLLGGVRVFAPPPRLWRPRCTLHSVCSKCSGSAACLFLLSRLRRLLLYRQAFVWFFTTTPVCRPATLVSPIQAASCRIARAII